MSRNLSQDNSAKLKVVLIHLGKAPAQHLWVNLESLLKRFIEVEFVLISDKAHLEPPKNSKLVFFQYLRSESISQVLDSLDHDLTFRSGFWKYTLERFIALEQYHRTDPETKIIHIESDILLFPEFPFDSFLALEKLAWQKVDESRDVASVFFSPHHIESGWLVSQLLHLLQNHNHLTDMTGLNLIRKCNPTRVDTIPSFSAELGIQVLREGDQNTSLMLDLSKNFSLFDGIFDPAAYGMWLSGSDPKNYHGRQILFDTEEIVKGGTFVDPSQLRYVLSESDQLFCVSKYESVRIWSLHIHSKDLRLLGNDWHQRLRHLVSLSSIGQVRSEFHPRTLLMLILSNIRDKTFMSWILHTPKLKPILVLVLKLRQMMRA